MKLTSVAAGFTLAAFIPLHAQQSPNVVFIVADDLGYGDLSCYGQEKFQTPHIDRLALNGTRFTRSYSGTTVSAPSRASLMTGLHTGHTPVRGNREMEPEGQYPLPLKPLRCSTCSKMRGMLPAPLGNGDWDSPAPRETRTTRCVDVFFGYNCQLLAHNYYPDHLWHNQTKIDLPENRKGQFGTYAQDLIQLKALEFIDNHSNSPFFLYVPMVLPHAELVVPEDSIIRQLRGSFEEQPYKGVDSGPTFRKGGYMSQEYPRATHAAMVKRIDLYVGQIIDKLKETGVYENTLIVFTATTARTVKEAVILISLTATVSTAVISVTCTKEESACRPSFHGRRKCRPEKRTASPSHSGIICLHLPNY